MKLKPRINHDEHAFGEHFEGESEFHMDELLQEDFHFEDQHAQANAIFKLNGVLSQYLAVHDGKEILRGLGELDHRLNDLELSSRRFITELRYIRRSFSDALLCVCVYARGPS